VGVPCLLGAEAWVGFSSGVGNVSSGKVALQGSNRFFLIEELKV
jgi:hypothetical protein